VSIALFAVWETPNDDFDVGPVGYVSRGVAFLLLGVIVGRFASERRALVARLAELATRDPLTGLANRTALEHALAVELARSLRHGHPGALLLADIDGFKSVNDTLGHRAGDEVLTRVANVFRQELRAIDTIARIGGDEFVILLPDTTRADGETVARKLADAVRHAVHEVAGQPVDVGVSVGCVCFDQETPQSTDGLLHAADQAMYRDKASRRAMMLAAAPRRSSAGSARRVNEAPGVGLEPTT
jgi:diguanylate cyclase (GGDEF)-like protein